MSGPRSTETFKSVNDLLFFDNLALFYLLERTPMAALARVFNSGETRVAGALLGLMTVKQRETIHVLMANEKDGDEEKNKAAADALLVIAGDLWSRGFIKKRGPHYYGVPRDEQLKPQ